MPYRGDTLISWHEGFKNLVTFKKDTWHNFEYYQKTDFFFPNASYGNAKDYELMLKDLNTL